MGLSNAIRAGLCYVELGADPSKLIAALNSAKARLGAFASTVAKTGLSLSVAGGAGVAAFGKLATDAASQGVSVGKLADLLGTSAEKASALAYAFKTAGISQEELAGMARSLGVALSQAADGSEEAQGKFARLGLSWRDLQGLPLDEVLARVGAAIDNVAAPADRLRMAQELLGEKGSAALQLFAGRAQNLKALMQEGAQVGAVTTGEQVRQAREVARGWQVMKDAVEGALLAVGKAALPTAEEIRDLAKTVVDITGKVRDWIAENPETVRILQMIAVGAVAAGTALTGLAGLLAAGGTVAGVAASAVGVFVGALALAKATLLAMLSPLGLVVAAVGGLGYLFREQLGQAASYLGGELSSAWGTMRDTATEAWGGIVAAIRAGDLQLAGAIAWEGLQVVWMQGVATLRNVWETFRDYWIDTARQLVNPVLAAWDVLGVMFEGITEAWGGVFDALAKAWTTSMGIVFDTVKAVMTAVVALVVGAVVGIVEAFKRLATALGLDAMVADLSKALMDLGGEFEALWRGRLEGREEDRRAAKAAAEEERDRLKKVREEAIAARKAGLDALVKEAKAAAGEAGVPRLGAAVLGLPGIGQALDLAGKIKSTADQGLGIATKGLFGAQDYRSVFAVGDKVGSAQLRTQEEIRDLIKDGNDRVVAKLDNLRPLGFV